MRGKHDPSHSRPLRRDRLITWAFVLVLAVFGGLLVRHFLVTPVSAPVPAQSQRQLRTITLYFGTADGTGLAAEGREIDDCLAETDCLKATVQALIDGPLGDLAPVFPPQVTLRGVTLAGSEVQIDFDRALIDSHPGGSLGELLTVYALADTIAVNFPHLRQLRILIDGAAVESLKGHVDLRQPVSPDFQWVLQPAAGPSAVNPPGKNQ